MVPSIFHRISMLQYEKSSSASRYLSGSWRLLRVGLRSPPILSQLVDLQQAADSAQNLQVGTNPGDTFSLFDGSISGTVEECSKDQKLVWKWRQSSWAEGVFSTCNIAFTENGAGRGSTLVFIHISMDFQQCESAYTFSRPSDAAKCMLHL